MHRQVHELKPLVVVVSNVIERPDLENIKGNRNRIRNFVEGNFKDSDSCVGDACDAGLSRR